jgi:hypothetical protein
MSVPRGNLALQTSVPSDGQLRDRPDLHVVGSRRDPLIDVDVASISG